MKAANDIAVGNVVGSKLFNIAVILELTALIRPPKRTHRPDPPGEIPILTSYGVYMYFLRPT